MKAVKMSIDKPVKRNLKQRVMATLKCFYEFLGPDKISAEHIDNWLTPLARRQQTARNFLVVIPALLVASFLKQKILGSFSFALLISLILVLVLAAFLVTPNTLVFEPRLSQSARAKAIYVYGLLFFLIFIRCFTSPPEYLAWGL